MKNITIGHVDPNWRAAAKARYYAERGDGEEYAFGTTPADALAKLEKREAAAHCKFDESLAEEIAFLALGAADVLKNHRGESLDAYDGYMGFIGEVIRHAPPAIRTLAPCECGGIRRRLAIRRHRKVWSRMGQRTLE